MMDHRLFRDANIRLWEWSPFQNIGKRVQLQYQRMLRRTYGIRFSHRQSGLGTAYPGVQSLDSHSSSIMSSNTLNALTSHVTPCARPHIEPHFQIGSKKSRIERKTNKTQKDVQTEYLQSYSSPGRNSKASTQNRTRSPGILLNYS